MSLPAYIAVLPLEALKLFQEAVAPHEQTGYSLKNLFSVSVVPYPGPTAAEEVARVCFWGPRPGRETEIADQIAAALPIIKLAAGTTDKRANFETVLAKAGFQRQRINPKEPSWPPKPPTSETNAST